MTTSTMSVPVARRCVRTALLVLAAAAPALVGGSADAATAPFENSEAIIVPHVGKADLYPSAITVAGMPGTISRMTVRLSGVRHDHLNDFDVLLVGPSGQAVVLLSDAGGARSDSITLTFDDSAPTTFSANSPGSGTYRPTNHGSRGDSLPAPAPPGPYDLSPRLSMFNGTDPNGHWSLFVRDDVAGDRGRIGGGWGLTITTVVAPTVETPQNIVRPNDPAVCGAVVTFDVGASGDPSPVVRSSPGSGTFFAVGTTSVTTTATNEAGEASASFTVTVNDEEAPLVTTPTFVVVDATSPAGAIVDYGVTATDNCPGVNSEVEPSSGSTFPIGTSKVTTTATDAAFNTTVSSFTVHVRSAGEQLADLGKDVAGIGPGKSLQAHVKAAISSLQAGDPQEACRQLRSLTAEMEAQRGKALTAAQADALLADVGRISTVIGC